MQITTPTSALGIRGTTALVEVPEGGAAATTASNIKLYPDADGRVGQIEVNDRQGRRLGALTQGASGFAIRGGPGGARFAAVPLAISPQQAQRDQGFVRQLHATQTVGRQIVSQQREFRRANPQYRNPARPSAARTTKPSRSAATGYDAQPSGPTRHAEQSSGPAATRRAEPAGPTDARQSAAAGRREPSRSATAAGSAATAYAGAARATGCRPVRHGAAKRAAAYTGRTAGTCSTRRRTAQRCCASRAARRGASRRASSAVARIAERQAAAREEAALAAASRAVETAVVSPQGRDAQTSLGVPRFRQAIFAQ